MPRASAIRNSRPGVTYRYQLAATDAAGNTNDVVAAALVPTLYLAGGGRARQGRRSARVGACEGSVVLQRPDLSRLAQGAERLAEAAEAQAAPDLELRRQAGPARARALPLVRLARPRPLAGRALRAPARRQQLRRPLTPAPLRSPYTALSERARGETCVRRNRGEAGKWRTGRTIGSGSRRPVWPCSRSPSSPATALASAPTATTGPTTTVGSTTATVTGTVAPGGQATTWYVEYGTVDVVRVEDSREERGVRFGRGRRSSAGLTGLKAGTTYHYRVVATNGAGTSHGTDAVFTTTVPPDVTTGRRLGDQRVGGDAERDRRPEQPRHDLLLRVRHVDELRHEDADEERRVSGDRAVRIGRHLGPADRTHLPLPHRRVERRRHEHRQGRLVHDELGTNGRDARRDVGGSDLGNAAGNGDTERALDHTVVRVRDVDELRHEDVVGERRLRARARASVTATVKNLKVATTYHFRLVAQNSSGKTYGADKTFSTVGAPSAQTGAAQGVGSDTGALTGSLDTRGRSTTWWFDYGTSSKYGKSTVVEERRLEGGRAERELDPDRPDAGDDLSLPACREERRRHDLRRGRDVHDHGRDAHRARAAGRLRRTHHALRRRSDAPGRRAGRHLRPVVRRRFVPVEVDGAHRCQRHLGLSSRSRESARPTRRAGGTG